MPEVRLFGGLREAADGAESIQLEGTTIRELLADLARKYPDLRDRLKSIAVSIDGTIYRCLLYTSPSPRDLSTSRMPSSA